MSRAWSTLVLAIVAHAVAACASAGDPAAAPAAATADPTPDDADPGPDDADDPPPGDTDAVPEDARARVVAPGTAPADTCEAARALAPIQQALVVVDAGDYRDDLRRSPCLPFGSPGPDLLQPVEVPAGARVFVAARSDWDAQVYLMDDCDQPTSCLAGADLVYAGELELLSWVNDGEARTVYAVADLFDAWPAEGELTFRVQLEVP